MTGVQTCALPIFGITRDTNNGEIAGVIINENDEALVGAAVSIEPSSGVIYYLDDNKNPNPSLTNTGTTGEFVINAYPVSS